MSDRADWALETASSIGARLCRDAIWAGRRCNWTGSSMELVGHTWTVAERSFGPDLYSGTSGIAWFLAALFDATREPVLRTTAEGALRQAASQVERLPRNVRPSLYAGAIGVGYAMVACGEALGVDQLITDGRRVVAAAAAPPADDAQLDVISGSAGAIGALLDLRQRYQDDALLEAAVHHGDHLLASASRQERGCSWDTLPGGTRAHLTGFAHGAAGIASALLELYAVTNEGRFRQGAEDGFRYEEAWYSPEHENWPDLRDLAQGAPDTPQAAYNVAWCHGAVGVGFSRLRAFALTSDQIRLIEAQAALRTATRSLQHAGLAPFGNYSLCHGHLGNADLLLYADHALGGGSFRRLAEQVGRNAAQQYEHHRMPWPCGVLGGGETPGLMLGLAGIGAYYLRLFDSQRITSPLLIAPPTRAMGA